MTERLKDTINVLVPTGALGAGVRESDVEAGLASGAHVIACDAGSTDSGPAYLATGTPKYSRSAVKTDLAILMRAQARSGLPLLIGSCGTSGCDDALNWTRDIALEICREHKLRPRIALLYSEQQPSLLRNKAAAGHVTPLAPMHGNGIELFGLCDRIVALMGPEPYIAALEAGADIVLGGRTTDTAVLAALPLARGAGAGAAWHAGKIAECGGLCTVNSRDGGVMIRVGKDAFEVEPLSAANACTPRTVSAHMLYENSDPFELHEPGGVLDVAEAHYAEVNERVVVVRGSRFIKKPYTMKLEGASTGAYQTIMLIGIQDRAVLAELERFLAQMHQHLVKRVVDTMGEAAGSFDISLRPYGWNAVSGLPMPSNSTVPVEIGLLFVATAHTQALATQIAKTCNPLFFHMPLNRDTPLPSYAFPFSPADIERGAVYEFMLNHIVRVDDPLELVRSEFVEMGELQHA
ncbi:acyclic terpene utilization AtuA family protein [Polaromonas sp. SM01]|uniref:acyclic terpene utilization AtuA family protein n=1 Tax=Polaromonas sp. SM01 TaxID=3085630 RepID=UPI0029813049|nr:acyclic terpene utilization AtuA family protein [Polaromonas sp. SM01]MDW5442362.1 acyclic terpene utilization AtuA family protein [Polaromonas sp. SM01]